jgi:Na+-driven multidrug efflux pump
MSAVAVVLVLVFRKSENYALRLNELRIDRRQLSRVLRVGVPSGLTSAMFNISNVFISSGINTFTPEHVTANTIAANIDNLTYVCLNSFQSSAITFAGQNYGANKPDRVKKSFYYGIIQVLLVGILISNLEILFADQLISLYLDSSAPNAEVVKGLTFSLMQFILTLYPICGIMEICSGTLRGMGHSIKPMIISIFGVCVVRIIWVLTVFKLPAFNSLIGLYVCYPVTWIICIVAEVIVLALIFKKMKREVV